MKILVQDTNQQRIVVEEIPGRDVHEVMFFRSLENEVSSISVEKSLNMQNEPVVLDA